MPPVFSEGFMKKISYCFKSWKAFGKMCYTLALYGFAIAGFLIIGAWAAYQLGLSNNSGGVDKNNRYLSQVSEMKKRKTTEQNPQQILDNCLKLAAIAKCYPLNARLILEGYDFSQGGTELEQMIAACELYIAQNEDYKALLQQFRATPNATNDKSQNAIEWMNLEEWSALKDAIVKDKTLIDSAAKVCGVEPRLIVGCLVGEQIRLFNSKREMYKKYLGPVKVLSVQSQFSLGVNGIKDFTAQKVEENLKDDTCAFYMGKKYENILNFSTQDRQTERFNRLVDYRNHYYSYLYTGCILHQIKKQWERAGYDISVRPEILFTLFNLGFEQSKPSPAPRCGGSNIKIGDKVYTFGNVGFDFYYSGELAEEFPFHKQRFEN